MPYGYLGTTPNQQLNNSGVFSVEEALALKNVGELGGSLELIQSQTASGVSTLDFTSLGDYNVHFMTLSDFQADTTSTVYAYGRLSNDGGSSWISTSNYERAFYRLNTAGTQANITSTSETEFDSFFAIDQNYPKSQAYIYFYNLTNSSKYSYVTFQSVNAVSYWTYFGGFILPVAETHNAIRLYTSSDNFQNGNAKLYGIKEI